MLWYKAWRETRIRFTISAAVIVGFCLFATMSSRQLGPPAPASISLRIHDLIYSGTAKGAFAILSIFLGLGGLVRERARRTSTFTLALPATRFELMRAQIGTGLAQLAALSLLPVLLVPSLSRLMHQPFPIADALRYGLLWFVCSSIIFASAYLLSSIWEGEYTAAAACYVLLMLQALITSWGPIRPYRLNLLWTMWELTIPWERLLAIACLSSVLLTLAAWRTQKQDF